MVGRERNSSVSRKEHVIQALLIGLAIIESMETMVWSALSEAVVIEQAQTKEIAI